MKKVAWILVLVGALNWGLVGLFDFNLVAKIFGDMSAISKIIYILVGVSAVYVVIKGHKCGKSSCCKGGTCSAKEGGIQGGEKEE